MSKPVKKVRYIDLTPGKQQAQLQQLSPEQNQLFKQLKKLIELSKQEEQE